MSVIKENLIWYGRYTDINGIRYFNYSASGFEFCFEGKKASCFIESDSLSWNDSNKCVLGVFVKRLSKDETYRRESFWDNFDDNLYKKIVLKNYLNECVLFESEKEEKIVIKVLRLSEVAFAYSGFKNLVLDGRQIFPSVSNADCKNLKIEFIGDSITCGYGVEGVFEKDLFSTVLERPDLAFAFLTAKKLKAEFNLISFSGIGIISNYVQEDVNMPENSLLMPSLWLYTDKVLSKRLSLNPELWDEKRFSPDVIVVNLGTNDASFVRDIDERKSQFTSSYRYFLENIHARSPFAKIVCCLGVMGQTLFEDVEKAVFLFKKDFPSADVDLLEFPVQLEEDGIATDWHPSAKTHEKMSGLLIRKLLKN